MFSGIFHDIGHAFSTGLHDVGNILAKATPILHMAAPIVSAVAPELAPIMDVATGLTTKEGQQRVKQNLKRKAVTMVTNTLKKVRTENPRVDKGIKSMDKVYGFLQEL